MYSHFTFLDMDSVQDFSVTWQTASFYKLINHMKLYSNKLIIHLKMDKNHYWGEKSPSDTRQNWMSVLPWLAFYIITYSSSNMSGSERLHRASLMRRTFRSTSTLMLWPLIHMGSTANSFTEQQKWTAIQCFCYFGGCVLRQAYDPQWQVNGNKRP